MPTEPQSVDTHVSVTQAVRHHLFVVIACLALGRLRRLDLRRQRAGDVHQHDERPGEPRRREPLRAHALVGASGRADQPGDRGPGGPLGGGPRRRRRPGHGPDDRASWRSWSRSSSHRTPRSSRSPTRRPTRSSPSRSRTRLRPPTSTIAPGASTRSTRPGSTAWRPRPWPWSKDLRAATAAAQVGTSAERSFQSELADALRNELVSLRAQRTALENSESPAGAVISPASKPAAAGGLTTTIMPVGGALAGLALGLPDRRPSRAVPGSDPVASATSRPRACPVVAAVPRKSLRARLHALVRDRGLRRHHPAAACHDPRHRPAAGHHRHRSSGRREVRGLRHRGRGGVVRQGRATAWSSSRPTESRRRAAAWRSRSPGLAQALLHERLERAGHAAAQCGAAPVPAPPRRVHGPEPRAPHRRPAAPGPHSAHRGRSPGRHPVAGHRQRRRRSHRRRLGPGPRRRDHGSHPSARCRADRARCGRVESPWRRCSSVRRDPPVEHGGAQPGRPTGSRTSTPTRQRRRRSPATR